MLSVSRRRMLTSAPFGADASHWSLLDSPFVGDMSDIGALHETWTCRGVNRDWRPLASSPAQSYIHAMTVRDAAPVRSEKERDVLGRHM